MRLSRCGARGTEPSGALIGASRSLAGLREASAQGFCVPVPCQRRR